MNDECHGFAVRELVEGNYRNIYKLVDKGRIDILTIHHRSRDFLRFGGNGR